MGRLAEAPLFIDDTAGINLMEIRSKCRRLKHKHGLDLVIVDYLQLMQSHRRAENRVQEVSELSRGLKILAKELAIPVIALSQLSRKPEDRNDRRPQLADLRESGSIEQDADLVCFLYRDEVYDPDSRAKGEAELIVAKHRNGPLRTVRLAPPRDLNPSLAMRAILASTNPQARIERRRPTTSCRYCATNRK